MLTMVETMMLLIYDMMVQLDGDDGVFSMRTPTSLVESKMQIIENALV